MAKGFFKAFQATQNLYTIQHAGGLCREMGAGSPGHCSMDQPLVTAWAGLQPRPQAPPQSAWHQHNQPAPPTNQPSRTVDKRNKSIPSTQNLYTIHVAWQGGAGWGSARRGSRNGRAQQWDAAGRSGARRRAGRGGAGAAIGP